MRAATLTQEELLLRAQARNRLSAAVRRGAVVRPKECSRCGLRPSFPLEAHHSDYTKPLKVRWLCINCHKRTHKILESSLGQYRFGEKVTTIRVRETTAKAIREAADRNQMRISAFTDRIVEYALEITNRLSPDKVISLLMKYSDGNENSGSILKRISNSNQTTKRKGNK